MAWDAMGWDGRSHAIQHSAAWLFISDVSLVCPSIAARDLSGRAKSCFVPTTARESTFVLPHSGLSGFCTIILTLPPTPVVGYSSSWHLPFCHRLVQCPTSAQQARIPALNSWPAQYSRPSVPSLLALALVPSPPISLHTLARPNLTLLRLFAVCLSLHFRNYSRSSHITFAFWAIIATVWLHFQRPSFALVCICRLILSSPRSLESDRFANL